MLKADRDIDRDPGSGRNAGYRIPSSSRHLSLLIHTTSIDPADVPLWEMHAAQSDRISPPLSKTKGWTGKALEFINSGPPALLNNSRRSHRRVVIIPFLKHAMEVHYG